LVGIDDLVVVPDNDNVNTLNNNDPVGLRIDEPVQLELEENKKLQTFVDVAVIVGNNDENGNDDGDYDDDSHHDCPTAAKIPTRTIESKARARKNPPPSPPLPPRQPESSTKSTMIPDESMFAA
jgi:hypothetical protein